MKRKIFLLFVALLIVGCCSPQYKEECELYKTKYLQYEQIISDQEKELYDLKHQVNVIQKNTDEILKRLKP